MEIPDFIVMTVRGLGAVSGAAAGTLALLTQGAFKRRATPLKGFWESFPFARYELTKWGYCLLGVILAAPLIQFAGDLAKDSVDHIATDNANKAILSSIKFVDTSVKTSADAYKTAVVRDLDKVSQKELMAESQISNAQGETEQRIQDNTHRAGTILSTLNDTLFPLKGEMFAWEMEVSLQSTSMRSFRNHLRASWEKNPESPGPFSGCLGSPIYYNFAKRPCLTFNFLTREFDGARNTTSRSIDKHLSVDAYATGLLIGNPIKIDIYRKRPRPSDLKDYNSDSPDYSATITPPIDIDLMYRYMDSGISEDINRSFEVIYYPQSGPGRDDDKLFVQYYWHAMGRYDAEIYGPKRTTTSIESLSDMAGAYVVLRYYGIHPAGVSTPDVRLVGFRMRSGDKEFFVSGSALKILSVGAVGKAQVFITHMPDDAQAVLNKFETVRSDEDIKPLSTRLVKVSVPRR